MINFTIPEWNCNYYYNNIERILEYTQDPQILEYLDSPDRTIMVQGNIHRTQFSSDNPENHWWFRITGVGQGSIHVFVCLRYKYPPEYGDKYYDECLTPESDTDVAPQYLRENGNYWELVRISYSQDKSVHIVNKNVESNPPKPRPNKGLNIINPKTGQSVHIVNKKVESNPIHNKRLDIIDPETGEPLF